MSKSQKRPLDIKLGITCAAAHAPGVVGAATAARVSLDTMEAIETTRSRGMEKIQVRTNSWMSADPSVLWSNVCGAPENPRKKRQPTESAAPTYYSTP